MWHPPGARRHPLPLAEWPTQSRAESSRLFSPLHSGRLALRDRTWVPAMVPWRATDDGQVTANVLEWYERFAEGRPGGLVVEATGVRDVPSGPLLRIGDDRFVPGLTQLTDRVRRASSGATRLFIQLIDFLTIRRRPEPRTYFERHLSITPRHRAALGLEQAPEATVRSALAALPRERLQAVLTPRELETLDHGLRERVTDMHLPHIADLPRELPGIFARAAARAEAAGFDGVELHAAHAYTLASFLSAHNAREDGYGGSLEERLRVPLEVLAAVRSAVSASFVVGVRFLADECIAGGNDVNAAETIGVAFARGGVDFVSLSRGGKFEDAKQPKVGWAAYPYTGPSGWECMPTTLADERGPFGRNVAACARVRRAIHDAGFDTPVVVAGGIATFEQAETILANEQADVVGAARQSLADPDWFEKLRRGQGEQIRRCTFTNYCEGLDQKHKSVTCKLWDRQALDAPDVTLDATGRRRLLAPRWRGEGE